MGIMPPDNVTIAITGASGTISGDMSGFTVAAGLRLFPGSNGGPEGAGREIDTYTPNGTTGASVTFKKPFTSNYPAGTKFYIAEGAPSGSAAYVVNQVQRTMSRIEELFGPNVNIPSDSQELPLRRKNGGAFARHAFYVSAGGDQAAYYFGSRTVNSREVLSCISLPDGVTGLDAFEVDRDSGGLTFRVVEFEIAAAATTDIGSVRSRRIAVNGNATISSLGSFPYQEKILKFTGISTLVHNAASLILPKARDITTLPGDTAMFSSNGAGNWRCLFYQRADGSPLSASFGRPDPKTFTAVEPTLDLDFKETFASGYFTRSTGSRRRDARLRLASLGPNAPKIEYDKSGLLLGARFEGSTINELWYSNNFDQGVWGKNEVAVSLPGNILAPHGDPYAWKLVPGTTPGAKYILQSAPAGPAARHTFSLFAKAAELTEIALHFDNSPGPALGIAKFDLLTGVPTLVGDSVGGIEGAKVLMVPYENGWYRCSITVAMDPSAYPNCRSIIYPYKNGTQVFTGNGIDGVYIFAAQQEPSHQPTAAMDTAGGPVGCASDQLTIPLGDWWNSFKGTIYAEARLEMDNRGYPRFVGFSDGTMNNLIDAYIANYFGNNIGLATRAGGVTDPQGAVTSTTYTAYGSLFKCAYTYTRTGTTICLNGGPVATGVIANFPGITQLNVGHVAGIAHTGGWIRRVLYFPRKLTDAELQRMTAL